MLKRRKSDRRGPARDGAPGTPLGGAEPWEAAAGGARGGTAGAKAAPKRERRARQLAEHWWNRLIEAVYDRSFSEQTELYASNQGTLDYVLNTIGQGAWGVLFPLLTVVATQLAGAEDAGMFTMAFVTATMLMYIGNYGVRTFQVSDLEENESFSAYVIQRVMTCVLMMGVGYLYCRVRGYTGPMYTICLAVFTYRMVDALADVYEGRLQQVDKLYLAGISMGIRSVLAVVVFSVLLFVTRSLAVASVAMAACAVASFVVVTLPLTLFETPKSRAPELVEIKELFVDCFPAFAGVFLYALIDNVPKFVMERTLSYDNQTYFNAIYFCSNSILMMAGLVYKPQIVRLSSIWNDRSRRARFDLIIAGMLVLVAVIVAVMLVFTGLVGVPLNGLLYATDFERFRTQSYLMVVAGGLAAGADFLFQILTVLRYQGAATLIYVIGFGVALVLSMVLVRTLGFDGAVWAYLVSHVVLFALFVARYVVIRVKSR